MSLARVLLVSLLLAGAALAPPAAAIVLSGHVTDVATGSPLPGTLLTAYGNVAIYQSTYSDANGAYSFDLPPWDPAYSGVDVSADYSGYVIQYQMITPDQATLDFALQQGGYIAGHIIGVDNAVRGYGSFIDIFDAATLTYLTSAFGYGHYQTQALAPGDYAVCDRDFIDNYLGVCYDGYLLPVSEAVTSFTPVTVAVNQVTDNIDFHLTVGPTVRATLHDSYFDAPITTGIVIWIYSAAGEQLNAYSGPTDGNNLLSHTPGVFELPGLPSGDYYFAAGSWQDPNYPNSYYLTRLYGGGLCTPDCAFATGTLVHVPDSGVVDLRFDLSPGFIVRGRVTDAATGQALAGVSVEGGDTCYGNHCTPAAVSDANGNYALAHLGVGLARVATHSTAGYIAQVWSGTPCAPIVDCLYGNIGNPVALTSINPIVDHIDFALQAGASFAGRVTSDGEHGIANATVGIFRGPSSSQLIQLLQTDVNGDYLSDAWLPGQYHVAAWSSSDGCVIYGGVPCAIADAPGNLDLSVGQQIPAPLAALHEHIDIRLPPDSIFAATFE